MLYLFYWRVDQDKLHIITIQGKDILGKRMSKKCLLRKSHLCWVKWVRYFEILFVGFYWRVEIYFISSLYKEKTYSEEAGSKSAYSKKKSNVVINYKAWLSKPKTGLFLKTVSTILEIAWRKRLAWKKSFNKRLEYNIYIYNPFLVLYEIVNIKAIKSKTS